MLKPESEDAPPSGQDGSGRQVTMEKKRAFKNKMCAALDKPLESEPRVKVKAPKPEPIFGQAVAEQRIWFLWQAFSTDPWQFFEFCEVQEE